MKTERPASPLPAAKGAFALVADDDPVAREMLAFLLRAAGFVVESAQDGQEAIELIRRRAGRVFDVVFADVQMPRIGGIELLSLVNAESPATATVIITGDRERELVSASLRGGAVEFLDKPFKLPATLRAAHHALEAHQRRHRQLAAQRRLDEVADIQRRLNRSGLLDDAGLPARLRLHTRFHTLHEAGGDLAKLVLLPPDRALLVLGDVSGHGIKEGFLAAYFQGVIQGMSGQAGDARAMASAFNDFLHNRWNDRSALALGTSVAASFVELDLARLRFSTLDCGGTGALLVEPDGSLRAPPAGGTPLGWFARLEAAEGSGSLGPSGQCWLWSDGLVELAARLGAPPLALAWRLLLAPEQGPADEVLADADDDIVVCRLDWEPPGEAPRAGLPWSPLHEEEFAGDAASSIDRSHEEWDRLLALGLPFVDAGVRHDITLCARESLLNALVHGCRGEPARRARLAFLLDPAARRLLLRVSDDGAGFDPAAPPPSAEPGHVSLGLEVIHALAAGTEQSPDGRRLEAVFHLSHP